MLKTSRILSVFFLILSTCFSMFVPSNVRADDSVTKWIACNMLTLGGVGEKAYSAVYTDWAYYMLRSRNTINDGVDRVDNISNLLLGVSGQDFDKNNEQILGYLPSTKTVLDDDKANSKSSKGVPNGGPSKSVYERFGVAGLNFSSYIGEWKYIDVKVCSGETEDVHANAFYDGRQEPLSTWQDRQNSADVRTQRINDTFVEADSVFMGILVGFFFLILKLFFIICTMLVNLSFTNVTSTIGLDGLFFGDGNTKGIISNLFGSVFIPLVSLIVLFGIAYVIYSVVINRGSGGFIKIFQMLATIGLGIVLFVFPSVLSLPNTVAVIGQSVVVNAFAPFVNSNDSVLCNSGSQNSVGSVDINTITANSANEYVDKLGKNVSTNIGCFLWEKTLFDNWSIIQFGVGYDDLWDKSTRKPGVLSNSDENAGIVGDAFVPLGAGKGVNNWAVYHLSTQTNAHAKTGAKDVHDRPAYNTGVANDWYRIVDATSNVYYKDATEKLQGMSEPVSFQKVDGSSKPTLVWSVWSGENNVYRLGMSLLSLFTGGIVLVLPTFFAGLSVVFAVMLLLHIMVLPLALLYAITGSYGRRGLQQYVVTLVDLMIKRIFVGALLVLSIIMLSVVTSISGSVLVSSFMSFFVVVAIITQWYRIVDLIRLPFTSFSTSGMHRGFSTAMFNAKKVRAGINAGLVANKVGESSLQAGTSAVLQMSEKPTLQALGHSLEQKQSVLPSHDDASNRVVDNISQEDNNDPYVEQFTETFTSSRGVQHKILKLVKNDSNISKDNLFIEEFIVKLSDTIAYEFESVQSLPKGLENMSSVSGNTIDMTRTWTGRDKEQLVQEVAKSIDGWLQYHKIEHNIDQNSIVEFVKAGLQ